MLEGKSLLAFAGSDVLRFAVPIETSSFCTEAALDRLRIITLILHFFSHQATVFYLMICLERNYMKFEQVSTAAGTAFTMFTCEPRPASITHAFFVML
jgi:hypothetical protein